MGPSLVGGAKSHFVGLPPSEIAGMYAWKDDNTLELTLRYIDSPHTERITCHFDQDNITIETQNSFNPNAKLPVLKGKVRVGGK